MAAASLLGVNRFNFNPLRPKVDLPAAYFVRQAKFDAKISVKCLFFAKKQSKKPLVAAFSSNKDELLPSTSTIPIEAAISSILKAFKAIRKPVVAAILLGALLLYDPNSALAASGGRMGGSSFSSHSSSSSSCSYSTRPPSPGIVYSASYHAPSPIVFGHAPSPLVFGGGSFYAAPAVDVVVAGSSIFLFMALSSAFVSAFLDRHEDGRLTASERTSVLILQVGLLGMGRSLQRDLNRIADIADTSTSEGLSCLLTEMTLTLLRHPHYCVSGYSSVDVKHSIDDGERRFKHLSIEERRKFDEETLVNVNNIKRRRMMGQGSGDFAHDNTVVTILVAAEGVHKLPAMNGTEDLKEALQKLGSIPASKILAVEVLWTPQCENDTLSDQELLENYPLLRPL